MLVGSLLAASSASAATYDYTLHFDYIGKPALADSQVDPQLQADTATCDATVGDQYGAPSRSYRACMLQHGWKYTFLTRTKVGAAPADPYFSSTVKLKPGHFIDRNTGLDCPHEGSINDCDYPSNGTVHYYDPDQQLPCTRTGHLSVCSSMWVSGDMRACPLRPGQQKGGAKSAA